MIFGVSRPTKPLAWWDSGEILGGRDEVAGGTWLACSRTGRVAFLTNVLELHTLPEAKSRGDLPVLFLEVFLLLLLLPLFQCCRSAIIYTLIQYCLLPENFNAEYKESNGICGGVGDRGSPVQWI